MNKTVLLVAFVVAPSIGLAEALPPEAVRLRNLGLAELENEQPANAESTFETLAREVSSDPLPWANLAIARLRQQKFDAAEEAIAQALKIAPEDPALLAIQAEILQWSGSPEESLVLLVRAAEAAPEWVMIQHALWRQADSLSGPAAEAAGAAAIRRLAELRPDNLLVQLQLGQTSIAADDRAAATAAFLRVREVIWQAPDAAEALLTQILEALEQGRLEEARVPALRLENVMKITPMYKEGLRELSPEIQGIPLVRFRDEPEPTSFGQPLEIRFEGITISSVGTETRALVTADLDADGTLDWARIAIEDGPRIEIGLSSRPSPRHLTLSDEGTNRLMVADLDNDGLLDLLAYGRSGFEIFRSSKAGEFESATAAFGLEKLGAASTVAVDFDIEGDLDLVVAGGDGAELDILRNSLDGPLESVGTRSLPALELGTVHDMIASDLDRDGDVDLVLAHDEGITWLDNLRQGSFVDRTEAAGLGGIGSVRTLTSADLNNDGMPDLVTAGEGISMYRNASGRFERWSLGDSLETSATFTSLLAFDADNDGRIDIAVGGPDGLAVIVQRPDERLAFVNVAQPPKIVAALAAADLDGDCDLDLLAAGPAGLARLENQGGSKNKCLEVRLIGLNKGNSKNNMFGLGATIEVRAGKAYQFREVDSDTTHFGLGNIAPPDLMRVVWTNGVPQNRLQPESNQRIVEEQVVKGSCPFLYAWNGGEIAFVTDLLWGAPAGLPLAPGLWASADPEELVKIEGAEPRQGVYDLRITEELWEAAFFDLTRLWVVDHPSGVEVASSLRIVPGSRIEDRVLGTRNLRSVRAWANGRFEVTDDLSRRDEIYADAWQASPYQGVAAQPWSLELDLGDAPGSAIRLLLDGWIFPSDASLNLAVAQRRDLSISSPRLEAKIGGEWKVLMDSMGFPAGKTKTMAVDTPLLPEGVQRLRIVGTQWLSFDRIAWSNRWADDEPVVIDRLVPVAADLGFRGFSRPFRNSPNGPHYFDYSRVTTESPWLPFPGRYTRYGDVRELLAQPDDRSVILGPGDEMRLLFDVSHLPPPPPGWSRTVFLESHGWDKDADRNTWQAHQVAPLPFRAMSGYPFAAHDRPPTDDAYRRYLGDWLTRVVEPVPGMLPGYEH